PHARFSTPPRARISPRPHGKRPRPCAIRSTPAAGSRGVRALRSIGPLFLLLALAACGSGAPSVTAVSMQGPVLMRGNGPEPDSLDPQRARSVESQNVLRDVCEGLTILGKDAAPVPGVAQKWDVSEDGKTYTFSLRDTARWSNGDRVVAADFVA